MYFEGFEKAFGKKDLVQINLIMSFMVNSNNWRTEEYCKELLKNKFEIEWSDELDILIRDLKNADNYFRKSNNILENTIQELKEYTNKEVTNLSENIESQIKKIEKQAEINNGDFHDYYWKVISGVDFEKGKLLRYIPIRIYVCDPLPDEYVLEDISDILVLIFNFVGFEKSEEYPAQKGSWLKNFILKSKEMITQDEVKERIQKVEDALEVNYLDKPQAEANRTQAESAAALLNALQGVDNACMQAGTLLLVKCTVNGKACVISRTLTKSELKKIEENQTMLYEPDKILNWLNDAS